MSVNPKIVETALLEHLEEKCVLSLAKDSSGKSRAWTVGRSDLAGLGLFAARNIECGELIFVDAALLSGPRGQEKYLPICAVCSKGQCPLFPCEGGCGLPVCSDACENSQSHVQRECSYLRERRPTCGSTWSIHLLKAVLPIRALFLTTKQRELLNLFEHHGGSKHGREIELLGGNVSDPPEEEEAKLMSRVCEIMDTTSFESVAVGDKGQVSSIRALYPMGALQNHNCTPNTRYHVDAKQHCYVSAVRPIRQGDELTMTYTDLLWDTTLRRHWLYSTKHFYCNCLRCSDPSEFGTKLAGLYCASDNCPGFLLPRNSLDPNTFWVCEKCGLIVNNKQIRSIRLNLVTIMEGALYKTPRQILRFMTKELPALVPAMSYIMMDLKFRIVSYFGRTEGLAWSNLSDDELTTKITFCEDLLSVLDRLGCGECKKKGLILYELYCSKVERYKRLQERSIETNAICPLSETDIEDVRRLLNEARSILEGDVLADNDLQNVLRI